MEPTTPKPPGRAQIVREMNKPSETPQQAALAGSKLLDLFDREWASQIDKSELRLDYVKQCVLGQQGEGDNPYLNMLQRIDQWALDRGVPVVRDNEFIDPRQYGFIAGQDDDHDEECADEYLELRDAWLEILQGRFEEAASIDG